MPRSRNTSPRARRLPRRGLGLALLLGVAVGVWTIVGFGGAGSGSGAAAGANAAAVPGAGAAPVAPMPAPTIRAVSVEATEQQFTADDGSRVSTDRQVTIDGSGFYGTAFGPFVHFQRADGSVLDAPLVIMESSGHIVASPPRGTYGSMTLVVENPDHRTAAFPVGL